MTRIQLLVAAAASALLITAGALVVRGVVAATTSAESYVSSVPRPAGSPLPVLWSAPRFALKDARGETVSTETLAGKVWIQNFIFTQCTSVCPVMTARLVQLERRLRTPKVRFVSVSVDPAHDSPEALRAYAAHWPEEPRWSLLATSPSELSELARGLRVAVAPSGDPRDPILHSRLLTLVDAEGRVRAVYDADDALAWERIANDAEELAGALPAEPPLRAAEVAGSPLARLGCNGCHDRPELAPRLAGGVGRRVTLMTGETVEADGDYLRESIRKPGAKVVSGYAPSMPSYALTELEASALVDAIRALPLSETAVSPPPAGGPAEDPICHMQVATTSALLRLVSGGHAYHFCSQTCLEAFRESHPPDAP